MPDNHTDAAVARLMHEAAGEDILDLSVGEPDQALPPELLEAAVASLRAGQVGYTPKLGLMSLREAVARSLPVEVAAQDVVITVGGTEAVAVALVAGCSAGDTIVIPDPAWPNYRVLAERLGLTVATYRQGADRADFMDLAAIEAHLKAGARMVVVNSPSNPMSSVASREDLEAVVALARRHDAWVLSDEAYESIVFDGDAAPSPLAATGAADVTFVARTFSKTFSMTGLRAGSLTSPTSLRADVAAAHGTMVGCAPQTAQQVALTALTTMPDRGRELAAAYRERFELALTHLGPWMATDTVDGHGGFYVWLDGSATGLTADELAAKVAERGVRVSSGNAYTVEESHAIRLALTAEGPALQRAFDAIAAVLSGDAAERDR